MSIPAPNYTQCPNIFFDQIMKTLSEGEVRVMMVIMRHTFGWHKQFDRISLSQLAKETGMLRTSVCRSLVSLISKRLVIKKKFGDKGRERCYYCLVVEETKETPRPDDDGIESDEEKAIISNIFDQSPKETRPVSLGDYPQSPKETTPSLPKRPTKETEQKKEKETTYNIQNDFAREPVVVVSFDIDKNEKPGINEFDGPTVEASFQKLKCSQVESSKAPQIHECLRGINVLTSEEKLRICKSYTRESIERAVLFVNAQKKTPNNFTAFFHWACKNPSATPPPPPEEIFKTNKKMAIEWNMELCRELDGSLSKYQQAARSQNGTVTFMACNTYVEFGYPTCPQMSSTLIKYDDPSFESKVRKKLQEEGFNLQPAAKSIRKILSA